MNKGSYDKGIADYEQALRLNPKSSEVYYSRGLAWQKQGKYDKALADHGHALRLNPKYAEAYYARGLIWWQQKEYDKAFADYNQALLFNPKYAEAYYARGMVWSQRKESDKALADYSEALPLTQIMRLPFMLAVSSGGKRGNTIRRSPTQIRSLPSGQRTPLHTGTAGNAGNPKGISKRPFPTSGKRHVLILRTPTLAMAWLGCTRPARMRSSATGKRRSKMAARRARSAEKGLELPGHAGRGLRRERRFRAGQAVAGQGH